MNVLNVTNVLPAPLKGKKTENDVLLTIADKQEAIEKNIKHYFVFVVPYSNYLLSLLSSKWREYYNFKKKETYLINSREIYIIPIPAFRKDTIFRGLLNYMGLKLSEKRLKIIIKEKKISLLHGHNVNVDAGIARILSKKLSIPYIITTRGITTVPITSYIKKCMGSASALISISIIQKKIADRYNKNSHFLPHGIDSIFLKEDINYFQDRPIKIITICRLIKIKNIDKVLLALENIEADFVYNIYGTGPDKERLTKILCGLGIKNRVNFNGVLDYENIPKELSRHDFFVMTSFPETFGRVYLEAMACGLPIIATKGCGVDGFIEEGKEGLLVDPENDVELKAALETMLTDTDLRLEMGRNAKALAQQYRWDNILSQLYKIYRNSIDVD